MAKLIKTSLFGQEEFSEKEIEFLKYLNVGHLDSENSTNEESRNSFSNQKEVVNTHKQEEKTQSSNKKYKTDIKKYKTELCR